MNKVWSDTERNYIRDNAATMKDKEIAAKLTEMTGRNVTIQAVRKQRQKMGITKAHGRGVCSLKKQPTRSDDIAQAVVQPSV